MNIEYMHASKYGNGARVAAEFARQMGERGIAVAVHHIREVRPTQPPGADLYVFSSLDGWAGRAATCDAS